MVLVFDASSRPGHGDEFVSVAAAGRRALVVLALNKIDRVCAGLLPLMAAAQACVL